ncbi:MAG: ATP-binding protein [Candidatus Aureabacteria bacterium]|nr:ATP-binding protein [Candidatus Auribacterota bacterium]
MKKQIVIISGKGGTGKTVVAGALAALAENKVMVDCDVDAANLHLLLQPLIKERHEFRGGKTAVINKEMCNQCGRCVSVCRFEAIKTPSYSVDSLFCEGCSLCSRACPVSAIHMKENISGEWFVSETKYGVFIHAKLGIAEENSGKLVSKIRQIAREKAECLKSDYVIIDGPPGIGCPVIASLTGTDCVLIVTEPTVSGIHDAARVIALTEFFRIRVKLVINKYDLNPGITNQIDVLCRDKGIPIIGRIGFDQSVVESMISGKTVMEYCDGSVKKAFIQIWDELKE